MNSKIGKIDAPSREKVASTIEALLEKAIQQQATDVHIEPRERNIVVRFRLNSLLQEVAKVPSTTLEAIVSNLKKCADLDPKQTRMPQNGSYIFTSKQYDVNVHVATMPTINGEKITLHLSPHLSEPATLESLGFWGDTLARIEQAAAEPHGLILASSPSATGTSLSLLGIVHLLNNPALNIAALEDPIEQHVAGVNQTQLDAASGISFSTGLQALLKQDPNVVMISQLHDRLTARTAIDAALDGHLMLGGLHTDSAAHGIVRLLQIHGEPFMVASVLRVSLAQRFVRRLCPSCRESYVPDAALEKDLKRWLKARGVTVAKLRELERKAAAKHIGASGPSSSGATKTDTTQLWRASPDGCEHCHFSGHVGHIGICEVIVNSENMKKLLAKNPTAEQIQKLAITEGTLPLEVDGVIKVLRGLTTLSEISARQFKQ